MSRAARNITATDKAGNSANDTITITDDTTAPTGHTITLTGAERAVLQRHSVTFSLGDGNDGARLGRRSGASEVVTRETGDLSAGACCAASAPTPARTRAPTRPSASGNCYRYTFTSPTTSATSRRRSGDGEGRHRHTEHQRHRTGRAHGRGEAVLRRRFAYALLPAGQLRIVQPHATATDGESGIGRSRSPTYLASAAGAARPAGQTGRAPTRRPSTTAGAPVQLLRAHAR